MDRRYFITDKRRTPLAVALDGVDGIFRILEILVAHLDWYQILLNMAVTARLN